MAPVPQAVIHDRSNAKNARIFSPLGRLTQEKAALFPLFVPGRILALSQIFPNFSCRTLDTVTEIPYNSGMPKHFVGQSAFTPT
jgi:hypothetical protein